MTNLTKRIIGCVLLAGSLAGFTSGCNCCKPGSGVPGDTTGSPTNNPSGSSGTLTVGVTTFSNGNNNQACFPSSSGWDKYYVLPGYLLGPNTTPPSPNPYPNSANLATVTIDTCDPLNGTTLETGIVIMYEFNPSDKVCASTSACLDSGKLTIDTRTMASGKRYRAAVFYKSSTAGSLQNVAVHWGYQ